ncbi:MAG: GTP pyrophosphokinase family protein [Bacillota bacterium]|nr:GTP pyrophosphokinase family protein [Bacillota bacterium]
MIEGLEIMLSESRERQIIDFAKQYRQLMMIYESGIKQITTKLEILNEEYKVKGERTPIESIKSRVKSPESIAGKLERKGLEVSIPAISDNLYDVAGVRVICSYISDIYAVRDMLLAQADVKLIKEKDYIKNPKINGYRSLHLVVEIPVYLSSVVYPVKVEIQIRTIAMDFWASLEHNIRYKTIENIPEGVEQELYECAETIAETDRKMEEIAEKIRKVL